MNRKIVLNGSLNAFFSLLIYFVFLLALYALMRLGFYFFNRDLFSHVELSSLLRMMVGGVKFDTVAILYINIVFILFQAIPAPFKYEVIYQRCLKGIFVFCNSLGVLVNLIDYVYYPFTLRRTTGTVLSQFSNEQNMGSLLLDFLLDYWYLLFLFVAMVYCLMKVYDLVQIRRPSRISWPFYLVQFAAFLFTVFLFIGGVRGGWAHSTRPITLSNAGDYVQSPEDISIVLNTPFSILKTLDAVTFQEKNYFTEEELDRLYVVKQEVKDSAAFNKLNVVILILESFGRENVGYLNKDINAGTYKGYTPFLDSLLGESYTFHRAYANGRKSIDALPSVISGIPSIGEPFVLSIYSANKTTSLAKLLADEGYETAFFHGAPNGSMGFSAYMNLAGINRYYGKNEYNNDADFDGMWGIWDEPFMQFMATELNSFPEPFFASFFSLSSHHPFKVPKEYENVFPKGNIPLHEPVGYTDNALRMFFAKASQSAWFKNTLFVICADHASQSYLPEYQTSASTFSIPIAFYYPGGDLKGSSDKLIQQIDILPTVLDYLNYPKSYFSFGFNALDTTQNNFVVNNIGTSYNLYYKDYFLTFDGERSTSLYNLTEDRMQRTDLLESAPPILDSMEMQIKAFIQRYNYSMIHDDLTVEK